jgi:hypothetical protein
MTRGDGDITAGGQARPRRLSRICAPERLVVLLEHRKLGSAVEALLDEERGPADGDVLPLRGESIGDAKGVCSPGDTAELAEARSALTQRGLMRPSSPSVNSTVNAATPTQADVEAAGAFQLRAARRSGRKSRRRRPRPALRPHSVVLLEGSGRAYAVFCGLRHLKR